MTDLGRLLEIMTWHNIFIPIIMFFFRFCVSETDVTSYYLHNNGFQCIQEQLKLSFNWGGVGGILKLDGQISTLQLCHISSTQSEYKVKKLPPVDPTALVIWQCRKH